MKGCLRVILAVFTLGFVAAILLPRHPPGAPPANDATPAIAIGTVLSWSVEFRPTLALSRSLLARARSESWRAIRPGVEKMGLSIGDTAKVIDGSGNDIEVEVLTGPWIGRRGWLDASPGAK